MPSTSSYGLRYPADTDPPDIPQIVQNLAEDVDGALRAPAAQLYATAVQAFATGTFTAVTFGGEAIDTHNGHSTTSNTSRWTCPSGWAGYYLVSGVFYLVAATGATCAQVRKNGSAVNGGLTRTYTPTAVDIGVVTPSVVVQLAVGDYVELWAEQNSGGSRSTFASGGFTSGLAVAFQRKA